MMKGQPPTIFALVLLLKLHWPCFQYFVLYCFDEFAHCYMAIEIFLDIEYIMPQ